jgi:hypothetical protein
LAESKTKEPVSKASQLRQTPSLASVPPAGSMDGFNKWGKISSRKAADPGYITNLDLLKVVRKAI